MQMMLCMSAKSHNTPSVLDQGAGFQVLSELTNHICSRDGNGVREAQ